MQHNQLGSTEVNYSNIKPRVHDAGSRRCAGRVMESSTGLYFKRVATSIIPFAWNACARIPGTWLAQAYWHRVNAASARVWLVSLDGVGGNVSCLFWKSVFVFSKWNSLQLKHSHGIQQTENDRISARLEPGTSAILSGVEREMRVAWVGDVSWWMVHPPSFTTLVYLLLSTLDRVT